MYGNASLAIVMLLLDYGANPNKEDKNGIYPLHIAAQRGSLYL
jgi:ankyrin repeat protein